MRRSILLLATTASLSACSFEPHYVRPEAPVPQSWPQGDAFLTQSEAALPSVDYKQVFQDPRLQQIITQALSNNRDLRVAAANIAAARAQYHIQRAELLPEVDASGGYSHAHANPTAAAANSGGSATGSTTSSEWNAQVGITAWEIDLFGRIRSESHASLNRYFETEAAARATRLTLVGDIGTAWLQYAADKSLLNIAQDTMASAQKSASLTKQRLDGGVAPRSDLDEANLVLHTAESDLANQKTLLAQDMDALRLLVGADVDPALLPNSIEEAAPTVAALPAGLSSDILLRRPDVVQAEYELKATDGDIGAARAALFPTISLTALAGFASNSLGQLFTHGAFNYSVSPNVSYPIFRAGAGKANVHYSEAQRDAALATYEKSVQTAFREVSDALARRGTAADQLKAQQALTASAKDNFVIADARYRGGIDTFLNSLDAQRSYYSAQQTLVSTQLTEASNLVTLYRVLGGDQSIEPMPKGPKPVSPTAGPADQH
jgi:multidrug efflux system outer membrane protein